MTRDNKVVLVSTTNHGYLYHVYHKDDLDRKKMLYFGEVGDDLKHNYCTCPGYSILEKCYHVKFANDIAGIKN